jgi:hypothetical protein
MVHYSATINADDGRSGRDGGGCHASPAVDGLGHAILATEPYPVPVVLPPRKLPGRAGTSAKRFAVSSNGRTFQVTASRASSAAALEKLIKEAEADQKKAPK